MKTLKNPWITLAVLVLILLCTVKHSAWVYLKISPFNFGNQVANWIYACSIVVALDLAVLVFTIHGRRITAIIYASLIFLTNMLYYLPAEWWNLYTQVGGMLIFSGMFAYAILIFSEIFVADVEKDARQKARVSRKKTGNNGKLLPAFTENGKSIPEKIISPSEKLGGKFAEKDKESLRKALSYRENRIKGGNLEEPKKLVFLQEIAEIESLLVGK